MILKPGVKVTKLTPQILLALVVAEGIIRGYIPYDAYHLTATSIDDGQHGEDTWHGEGRAADIRTKDLPPSINKQQLTQAIKDALPEYTVLLEYEGKDNEHIHIEYDPHNERG